MEPNKRQPRLSLETAPIEWICVERLVAILFVAILIAASAAWASTPKLKFEVQFPNSGTEMHLLGIGQPDTSGTPKFGLVRGLRGRGRKSITL